VGQISIFFFLGHLQNGFSLIRQKLMDRLSWTWLEIPQALAIFLFPAPSHHTAPVNPPENTGSGYRKAFFFGLLNHNEDL